MRYNYDDDFGDDSDELSNQRSTRQSNRSTPADMGPVVTASGRQVRARGGGMYGESLLSGQATNADTPGSEDFDDKLEASEAPRTMARPGRVGALDGNRKRKHIDGYNAVDQMSDEDDASESENEWNGGDDEEEVDDNAAEDEDEDDEEDMSEDEDDEHLEPSSRIVKLKIGRHSELPNGDGTSEMAKQESKIETPTVNGLSAQGLPKEDLQDISMADASDINTASHLAPKQEPGLSHPVMTEDQSSTGATPTAPKVEPTPTPAVAPGLVPVQASVGNTTAAHQQHPSMNGFATY